AALVEHFTGERFVHASALFAPEANELADWKARNAIVESDDGDEAEAPEGVPETSDSDADALSEGFREAAE
ncbi:MAG: plasmid partitioning protein, partial [Rhodobiaceae bacterium]|nr:plasmid partitioning protein [Rhodobiaceae bacterium]